MGSVEGSPFFAKPPSRHQRRLQKIDSEDLCEDRHDDDESTPPPRRRSLPPLDMTRVQRSGDWRIASEGQTHEFIVRGRSLSKRNTLAPSWREAHTEQTSTFASLPHDLDDDCLTTASCASSRCTSRSASTSASTAPPSSSRTVSRTRVNLPCNGPSDSSFPFRVSGKAMSRWAMLKNSCHLPSLVGTRASKCIGKSVEIPEYL